MKKRIASVLTLTFILVSAGCASSPGGTTDVPELKEIPYTQEQIEVESDCLAPIPPDSISQNVYNALQNEWDSWNLLSKESKMLSRHMPGHCRHDFDSWEECEEFLGFTIPNPLEDCSWLERGTYVAMPLGFRDAPNVRTCTNRRCTPPGRVFSRHSALLLLEIHKVFLRQSALIDGKIPRTSGIPRLSVQVLRAGWYGTEDGHVEWIHVETGYRDGEVRVMIAASLYGDPADTKTSDSGWAIELERQNYLADVNNAPLQITSESTENYYSNMAYQANGNVLYRFNIVGEPDEQTQVENTLEKVISSLNKSQL